MQLEALRTLISKIDEVARNAKGTNWKENFHAYSPPTYLQINYAT